MPMYEYLCNDCGKKFSLTMTIAKHDKGLGKCPKCGSGNIAQRFSTVFTKTSRKS